MATMDQFLKKALNEGELVGDKADEGAMVDSPGTYEVFVKANMKFNADSMDDAMAQASAAMDKAVRSNRKLQMEYEIDGVDGPY